MHIYTCPYCPTCRENRLTITKSMEVLCDHNKPFFNKDKECEEDEFKCKEVFECKRCETQFKATDGFKREQKRKIKDG